MRTHFKRPNGNYSRGSMYMLEFVCTVNATKYIRRKNVFLFTCTVYPFLQTEQRCQFIEPANNLLTKFK